LPPTQAQPRKAAGARTRASQNVLRDAILKIIYPAEGEFRARAVCTRSRGRWTSKHRSWKNGRHMQAESPAEKAAMTLLDADPSVLGYCEQPLVIRYVLNGQVHIHYPDLLVDRARQQLRPLWEVKDKAADIDPFTQARTDFLIGALPQLGYEYRLVLGENLRQGSRLTNSRKLLDLGHWPVSEIDREHIRKILLAKAAIAWKWAVNGDLGPRGQKTLCRLTLEGMIGFDLDQPWTPSTQFTLITTTQE
jgi:hypothetical protein